MALNGDGAGSANEVREVPLDGVLAEFRDALRAEMEAARRNAQSSAVQLIHGERIGRSADRHQYLFKLESPQLALPDDMPGDLYIAGRGRFDATIVSLAGTALTLSVVEDMGQHIPRASLSSNLSNLLRSLIARIEDFSQHDRENHAGDRLLGAQEASGEPVTGLTLPTLNDDQLAAVASGLGRDTTFIQGPPGTGKTKTIGTLGEQLARAGRSVLLVSHTNTAVDQALLHIARSLGPEVAAEGKVLRLGEPKDERVAAQPDLLVRTHVERRSAELTARRVELAAERAEHVDRLSIIERLLALCEWANGAVERLAEREQHAAHVGRRRERLSQLTAELEHERERSGHWEDVFAEAEAAQAQVEARAGRDAAVQSARQAFFDAEAARPLVEATARTEADAIAARARGQAEALVAEAQQKVAAAEAEASSHREQLDRARQLRLARDRIEVLPSVEFARSRVARVRKEASEADAAARLAEAAADKQNELHKQTQAAGAMTRRLKRLPRPDEQERVAVDARERAAAARANASAAMADQTSAEQQLAETERLKDELELGKGTPSVSEVEALLAADSTMLARAQVSTQRAHEACGDMIRSGRASGEAHVREALAAADTNIARAQTTIGDVEHELVVCESAIAEFRRGHQEEPAAVLERARAGVAELLRLRAEVKAERTKVLATEAELRAAMDSERAAFANCLSWRPPLTDDVLAVHDAMTPVVRNGTETASVQDIPALLREKDTRTSAIPGINSELASIDEQLAQVQAAVVADATVVATTLTRAYLRDEVQDRRFDTVVLDEASMAPIPALWIAASVADANVVIVGDPHQLPPIAQAADDKHQDAPEYKWLARDVFVASGVVTRAKHLVKLRTQYRMHPAISAAPNALVYDGELRDGPNTSSDSGLDPWYRRDWGHDSPVLLVDTEKADAWCSTVVSSGRSSRLNFLSATIAVDLAERLLLPDRPTVLGGESRIIIATPYRPQARLITLLLREADLEGEVIAGTVHSFQGSEAPVVIYDLVVDEPHRRAGLFSPQWDDSTRRQFNVGLTRARHRLFVIGDFSFLKSNGKKAFLGRLLEELDGSPRVDAEAVVPLGLSARAATAQTKAYGHEAEPAGADRVVVTQRDFDELFLPDLQSARERVVIYSPFITTNRLTIVEPQLRAAVERGVSVYVVTKTVEDRSKTDSATYRELMATLHRWGVIVIPKKAMHEKLVFVDSDVVWVGSLNPLSFRDTREIMERRRSRKVADDYRKTLQLDVAFSAYEEGETDCPICGSAMALAEGDRGTYRRCVTPGCYSRSLADPPLKNGKLACHNCGGDVYYGSWGDKPAWRCHENTKHRTSFHPNHLKLPAMTALIATVERRRLEKLYVGNGSAETRRATGTSGTPRLF